MRVWILLLTVGCTQHVQLGDDGKLPGLLSLEVSPLETAIAFDDINSAPRDAAFIATGHFNDGAIVDVTQLVDWNSDNPFPGTFVEPGHYSANGAAAGHVRVRASSGEINASAAMTISVWASIVDNVFPPPSVSVFEAAVPVAAPAGESSGRTSTCTRQPCRRRRDRATA